MAIIISNDRDMVSMINRAVEDAQLHTLEMVVVPMVCDNLEKGGILLLDVKGYDPRVESDALPTGAIGKVTIGKTRTVHDLLNALESRNTIDVRTMQLAIQSIATRHERGKTRKINTMAFGAVIVDLQKFSQATGFPTKSPETVEYSVFLREIPQKNRSGTKIMLVLVKGTTDTTGGESGKQTALKSMLARMEYRLTVSWDEGGDFHAPDLDNGWQLYNDVLFSDLLGWWKNGYIHRVSLNESHGLNISY